MCWMPPPSTPKATPPPRRLLDACGYTAAEIGTDAERAARRSGPRGPGTPVRRMGVGEPTLNDIVAELCKPGRDVRDSLPKPLLRSDVMGLEDLKPGMELTGTVRNVIDFGAFVDLGVHQDGLVHVSQISDKFIKHPREVLKVGRHCAGQGAECGHRQEAHRPDDEGRAPAKLIQNRHEHI